MKTEAIRLKRTNDNTASFRKQVVFFAEKLENQGYESSDYLPIFYDILFGTSDTIAAKKDIIPFKAPFNDAIADIPFGMILHRDWPFDDVSPVVCFLGNTNLFRERYKRFLSNGSLGLGCLGIGLHLFFFKFALHNGTYLFLFLFAQEPTLHQPTFSCCTFTPGHHCFVGNLVVMSTCIFIFQFHANFSERFLLRANFVSEDPHKKCHRHQSMWWPFPPS